MTLQIIDPRQIPQSEFPFLISAGSSDDVIAKVIEFWDKSTIDHSMFAINSGKFVWQSMTGWYGEKPMDAYLKKGGILKFYQLVEVNDAFKLALSQYCQERIKAPWWEKMYNWIGIIGQMVGIHWISTPGLEYCSQDVVHGQKKCAYTLPKRSFMTIENLDDNTNPAALDNYYLQNGLVYQLYGTWDSKTGIVV